MRQDVLYLKETTMNCTKHNSLKVALIVFFIAVQLLFMSVSQADTIPTSEKQCDCKCDEIVTLQRAPVTHDNVIKWAKSAVLTTFSYGFGNYQTALDNASLYFTPKGWVDYKRALYKSGNLDAVINNKLVVSSQLSGSPRIVKTGINTNGQEIWEVQVPVQVSYQNALHSFKQNLLITLQIDKSPHAKEMKDVGISQFVAEPETA